LVGVAPGAEGDLRNEIPDEEMQHPADGEAGAGRVFECVVVGRPVDGAVH
jgi:hypothetical protein